MTRITECDQSFSKVKNMIVESDTAYVGMDKMLVAVTLSSGEYQMYTFLGEEDRKDLERNI